MGVLGKELHLCPLLGADVSGQVWGADVVAEGIHLLWG